MLKKVKIKEKKLKKFFWLGNKIRITGCAKNSETDDVTYLLEIKNLWSSDEEVMLVRKKTHMNTGFSIEIKKSELQQKTKSQHQNNYRGLLNPLGKSNIGVPIFQK